MRSGGDGAPVGSNTDLFGPTGRNSTVRADPTATACCGRDSLACEPRPPSRHDGMKWGIVGFGEIAPVFIEALRFVEGQELTAVASRSKSRRLSTDLRFQNAKIYSDYQDLFDDPDVEVVYICTSNQLHNANVLAALRSGKHVLCEKPLGMSGSDAAEMVSEARGHRRFLMEGMWTRFLPAYRHSRELAKDGAIGRPAFLRADFGFLSTWGPDRRLKNKDLVGGTLLDNADYGLFLGQDFLGERPSRVAAFARFCETGVEDLCGIMLQYPDGSVAQLFSSFQQKTNQEALVYGDKGHLHLASFWHGTEVALYRNGNVERWDFPFKKNGFEFEIEAVVNAIAKGAIECSLMPHSSSIETALLMDDIIKQIDPAATRSEGVVRLDKVGADPLSPNPETKPRLEKNPAN